MARNFTTSTDIRDELGLVLDEGADGREHYDIDGIAHDIAQTIGLPSRVWKDEDGDWFYTGASGSLDSVGFWNIVARHDTTA